jgi:hypothetical protein
MNACPVLERSEKHGTLGRMPRTRLVRASQLPPSFEIVTTYHEPFKFTARPCGGGILVSCRDVGVILKRSQRVRVLVKEAA